MYNDDYFANVKQLPNPLPKEEVQELIKRINQGDMKAKEKLVTHNLKLVLHEVYGRFNMVDYDKNDLVSIGNIGLMNAVNSYDCNRNIEFSTYAVRCIDNEIYYKLRQMKKECQTESIEKIISSDDNENGYKVENLLYDDTYIIEDYIKNELYKRLGELCNELSNKEKEIIILYFGFNNRRHTQKELAEMFSCSRASIYRIINTVTRKLRKQLAKEGFIELKNRINYIDSSINKQQKIIKKYK